MDVNRKGRVQPGDSHKAAHAVHAIHAVHAVHAVHALLLIKGILQVIPNLPAYV